MTGTTTGTELGDNCRRSWRQLISQLRTPAVFCNSTASCRLEIGSKFTDLWQGLDFLFEVPVRLRSNPVSATNSLTYSNLTPAIVGDAECFHSKSQDS